MRTGETDDPKARRQYNNMIFRENNDETDPYVALKVDTSIVTEVLAKAQEYGTVVPSNICPGFQ